MTVVHLAVEGVTDVAAAERMLSQMGLQGVRAITDSSRLDRRARSLFHSRLNWLVLRDLDRHSCAPELLHRIAGGRTDPRVCLRIAVRALESWLMADREGLCREFQLSPDIIPPKPDDLEHPKRTLIHVLGRARAAHIRRAVTPRPGSRRTVGPDYAIRIEQFARFAWDPEAAAKRSPSLFRALGQMHRLKEDGIWS